MKSMTSRFIVFVLLLFAVAACQSDTSPKPRYTTDISDSGDAVKSKAENRYFIEFRSRYALSYGHTYVVFGRTNAGGQMINPEVAGLHPKSYDAAPYVAGHFVPVPAETGPSDGDLEEPYRSASWRLLLSEAQYNKVVAYIRGLQARSQYWNATVYNCNAFVAEIARSMGYRTPPIWLRPQQFVTQLREMNGG
jgi:hypothetical protein